jgi:hypothetical protein
VHRGDLLVATQGRGLWVLDDLSPIRAIGGTLASAPARLLAPRPAYRVRTSRGSAGANPGDGAVVDYLLRDAQGAPVTLDILDSAGTVVRSFSSASTADESSSGGEEQEGARSAARRLPAATGHNRFVWDLRYPGAYLEPDGRPGPDRDIIWGYTGGPTVVPGRYSVRLRTGSWSEVQPLEVRLDPRVQTSRDDLAAQRDLMLRTRDALSDAQRLVRRIRDARPALVADSARNAASRTKLGRLATLETLLVELRDGDVAKLRPELSDQLAWLNTNVGSADTRPTDQAVTRFAELSAQLDAIRRQVNELIGPPVPRDRLPLP